MNALQRTIIATAQDHMVRQAEDHALHPWGDMFAHAYYARQFTATTFHALGEHTVYSTTAHGGIDMAANALDYAAAAHDGGNGFIHWDAAESMVTLYLSEHPDLPRMLAAAGHTQP